MKRSFSTFLFLAVAAGVLAMTRFELRAQSNAPSLIESYKLVEAASVADAMEQLYGTKAYMKHDMRPVSTAKFAGPAVTVLLKKEENHDGAKALQGMLDAIDEAAPGSVYVM